MKISKSSRVATRMSSRFRLLARTLEKGTLPPPNLVAVPNHLAALINSDFPRRLKTRGNAIRGGQSQYGSPLAGSSIDAEMELAHVMANLEAAISHTRHLEKLDKQPILEDLRKLSDMLESAFSHDDGTLFYRKIRKSWIRMQPPEAAVLLHVPPSAAALAQYSKTPPSAMAYFVAHTMHANFATIPELCLWCPRIAKTSYCKLHAPNKLDNSRYDRGQRIFLEILKTYPNKEHQYWRHSRSKHISDNASGAADIKINKKWLKDFDAALKNTFKTGWQSKIESLLIELPLRARTIKELASHISTAIMDDDKHWGDQTYFAGKLKELTVFNEADKSVRRRGTVSFKQAQGTLAKLGSTKLAAAHLGISQRMIQMILKRGRVDAGDK